MSADSKRKPSPLRRRPSLPSFDSSLEAFVARANETLADQHDAFDPAAREAALKAEIARLHEELAESRAREVPRKKPYLATISAFVIGAAGMFGFGLWRESVHEGETST